MALVTVVFWRDMPAQVIVKSGRKQAKRQLPERFEQAIDRAAMKSGASGTDEYLADWRRADPYEAERRRSRRDCGGRGFAPRYRVR